MESGLNRAYVQWSLDSIGICAVATGLNRYMCSGVWTQLVYVQWSLDSIGICTVESGLNRYRYSGVWTQ